MDRFTARGKRLDNDEWIYGNVCASPDSPVTIFGLTAFGRHGVKVDPETIGQQSPFRSMKDQPIFDGDILLNHDTGERLTVFWCDVCGKWMYEGKGMPDELYSLVRDGVTYACEVVGDVYGDEGEE